jgi:hypothetical protein
VFQKHGDNELWLSLRAKSLLPLCKELLRDTLEPTKVTNEAGKLGNEADPIQSTAYRRRR